MGDLKTAMLILAAFNILILFAFYKAKNSIKDLVNKRTLLLKDIEDTKLEKEQIIKDAELEKKRIIENTKIENEQIIDQYSKDIDELKLNKEEVIEQYLNESLEEFEKRYESKLIQEKNIDDSLNKLKIEFIQMQMGFNNNYDLIFSSSLIYKQKISELNENAKRMIKDGTAVKFSTDTEYINDNDIDNAKKLLIRAFNTEVDLILSEIKSSNIETKKAKIVKAFSLINTLNSYLEITAEYVDLQLQKADLLRLYYIKREEEKELLREEREKARENKIVEQELQKAKTDLRNEKYHFRNAIDKVKEKLLISTLKEKKDLEKQLEEYKLKLQDLEDQEEDIDYRINNRNAGYVYVISNIGSFGEEVYKIGVTRRLEPMERIAELSSASVPFKFDVRILVFSTNAFELENKLHKRFSDNRVNLVNSRKEFFKVPLEDIRKAIVDSGSLEFDYFENDEAEEYKETLKILNSKEVS